jgi:cell division protein FtsW (lipid II flippase)
VGEQGPVGRGCVVLGLHLARQPAPALEIAHDAGVIGFLGAAAFLVLYLSLILFLLSDAASQRLVLAGIALYFAAYHFVNSGVNLGLIPMTGITLPLLSTGGSSLMVSFLSLGIALGLIARVEPSLDPDAFRD